MTTELYFKWAREVATQEYAGKLSELCFAIDRIGGC